MTSTAEVGPYLLKQPTFCDLAEAYSISTKRLVFICGAGPSRDAGLPDWPTLVQKLRLELLQPPLAHIEPEKLPARISAIDEQENPWRKFSLIKNYMGAPNFNAAVRRLLSTKSKTVPSFYRDAWTLRPHGILTLNLDRFAAQGFDALKTGERINEVLGYVAHQYLPVVQVATPFVVNLHGETGEPKLLDSNGRGP